MDMCNALNPYTKWRFSTTNSTVTTSIVNYWYDNKKGFFITLNGSIVFDITTVPSTLTGYFWIKDNYTNELKAPYLMAANQTNTSLVNFKRIASACLHVKEQLQQVYIVVE